MGRLSWLLAITISSCGGGEDGGATSDSATPTSDFTPPTGAATGPGRGPWNNRLMVATSEDGLSFTRANRVLTDQADVPDLVVDASGRIYLYYVAWTAGDRSNVSVVAISDDSGETWAYKYLEVTSFDGYSSAVDPDVQILDDGTFRIYLTSSAPGSTAQTWYAEGSDGIHFANKGSSFAIAGTSVLDPSTIHIGSTWHIFAGGGGPTNYHGTSVDGTSFTYVDQVTIQKDSQNCMAANGISVQGGYRFYGFTATQPSSIASFFTTDGSSWTAEDGWRLEPDSSSGLEGADGVKDPAVVRLANGRYLLVYVTGIP